MAGVPVERARKIAIAMMTTNPFAAHSAGQIARRARLNLPEVLPVLEMFEQEGFAEHTDEDWWQLTLDGRTLAKAVIAEPLTRAEAEEQLERFLDEVRTVNSDPAMPEFVPTVEVYGSLARPEADEIGDIDLVVRLRRRYPKLADQERTLGIWALPDQRRPWAPVRRATGRLPYVITVALLVVRFRLTDVRGRFDFNFCQFDTKAYLPPGATTVEVLTCKEPARHRAPRPAGFWEPALRIAFERGNAVTRRYVAQGELTPIDVIEEASRSAQPLVRAAAGRNPRLPYESAEILVASARDATWMGVLDARPEILGRLRDSTNALVRRRAVAWQALQAAGYRISPTEESEFDIESALAAEAPHVGPRRVPPDAAPPDPKALRSWATKVGEGPERRGFLDVAPLFRRDDRSSIAHALLADPDCPPLAVTGLLRAMYHAVMTLDAELGQALLERTITRIAAAAPEVHLKVPFRDALHTLARVVPHDAAVDITVAGIDQAKALPAPKRTFVRGEILEGFASRPWVTPDQLLALTHRHPDQVTALAHEFGKRRSHAYWHAGMQALLGATDATGRRVLSDADAPADFFEPVVDRRR